MFRGLAAFIFGSNTTEGTNCQRNNCSENLKEQRIKILPDKDPKTCFVEDKTAIEESQSTAVTTGGLQKVIRNKDSRNNKKNKSKRQEKFTNVNPNLDILTSESHKELDSEENDWIFLENDGDRNLNDNNNTTSTPTLEILSELQPNQETFPGNDICVVRRQKKNKSNQKSNHKSSLRHVSPSFRECDVEKKKESSPLHSSSLNLRSNSLNKDRCNDATRSMVLSESGVQQLLRRDLGRNVSVGSFDDNGSSAKLFTMVDSWYMTPPSCFDLNGPIHLEIPRLENLLIEHPR
uniref:Tumor protein p53-inducible nuclear protein 1 n=1 Tax=Ceratitis capitata TaxID=7213 RepID=W8BK74_CERCA